MPSYADVTERAGSVLAMTGLTGQEFEALLPHFERAFVASMRDRTIDGQPRASRSYSTYENCPLPTMADTWLFMLTYLKQNPLQEVQGQLFGMSQSNANKWIHLLHDVLNQALAQQGLLPARTADDLAVLLATAPRQSVTTPPLFGMMALSARSIVRLIRRNNGNATVARKSTTRSKTSS